MSNTSYDNPSKKSRLNLTIDDLDSFCKCSICYEMLDIDCKSCINGHLTCLDCFGMLSKASRSLISCPHCRGNMTNIKVLFISQLYDNLNVSLKCKYENCQETIPINQYREHIKKCKHQPSKCPFDDCKYIFSNNIDENINHFVDKHKFKYQDTQPILEFTDLSTEFKKTNEYVFKLDDKTLYLITLMNYNQINSDLISKHKIRFGSIFIEFISNNHNITLPKYKVEVTVNNTVISASIVDNNHTSIAYSIEQINMLSTKEKNTFDIKMTKLDD
jgi:hypothetical protein